MNTVLKQKKILIVIQNDLLGGAEQLLKLLSEEYNNQFCNINIIFVRKLNNGDFWKNIPQNIKIKNLNSKSYFVGFIRLFFLLLFSNEKFDLIFSSNININCILGSLKKINLLSTKKLIIRETTSVFHREKGLKKFIQVLKYKIGYSGADLIICQTDVMRTQFLENLPHSNIWNLKVFQNPINTQLVLKKSKNEIDFFDFKPSVKYIVSAGRFIYEKGFDLLINSFALIQNEFNNYKLIILGEGKLREDLELIIKELHLENKVFLPGHVKNPYPYFRNADICVVSSRLEGFPNVLLQMALLNNKIVTTKCAGNLDKIPAITICNTNDSKELAESLKGKINEKIDNNEIEKKLNYLNSLNIKNYIDNIELELYK